MHITLEELGANEPRNLETELGRGRVAAATLGVGFSVGGLKQGYIRQERPVEEVAPAEVAKGA